MTCGATHSPQNKNRDLARGWLLEIGSWCLNNFEHTYHCHSLPLFLWNSKSQPQTTIQRGFYHTQNWKYTLIKKIEYHPKWKTKSHMQFPTVIFTIAAVPFSISEREEGPVAYLTLAQTWCMAKLRGYRWKENDVCAQVWHTLQRGYYRSPYPSGISPSSGQRTGRSGLVANVASSARHWLLCCKWSQRLALDIPNWDIVMGYTYQV